MDISSFWEIIEKSKKHNDEQVSWITEELNQFSLDDIVDYEFHFLKAYDISYHSKLWGAAYIIMGGCSDDSFDYFRAWLISQGESVFTMTLANPDILAELIPQFYEEEGHLPEYEEFLNIGFASYMLKKTGEVEWNDDEHNAFLSDLELKGYEGHHTNIELDWENEDDLVDRFPKLWERFGENPLG